MTPTIAIVGVGVDAQQFEPMVQVLAGDNTTLLEQAGYPIGHGLIAAVANLPSNGGTLTEQQLDALIGPLVPGGPNTLVMVFLDLPPSNAPAGAGAYHTGFLVSGQSVAAAWVWSQPLESILASHEYDEATARMAGATFEICDPVEFESEPLDGINISDFVLPDGVTPAFAPQPLFIPAPPMAVQAVPAQPSKTADALFALGVERLEEDVYYILSLFYPQFEVQQTAATLAYAANPWQGTPQGDMISARADAVFLELIQ